MVSPSNAVRILEPYDIILDCTDNPPTRYLLSDAAVLLGKPLVSGAAQRYDGQLCIYNLGEDGPCYRCLFPKAPEPGFAGSCQETGILGAVTGVIGNLQALEAIKLITGLHGEKLLLDRIAVCDIGTRWNPYTAPLLRALALALPIDQDQGETSGLYSVRYRGPYRSGRRQYGLRHILWWPNEGLGQSRVGRFGREDLRFRPQADARRRCIQGHLD